MRNKTLVKSIPLLLFAFTLNGCVKTSEGDAWSIKEAEILSVSKTLPACGIMYTLVEMELRDEHNQRESIFLPCVEVIKGPLPDVGTSCTAKGEWSIINGSTAKRSLHDLPPQKLAHELTCGAETYVFGL